MITKHYKVDISFLFIIFCQIGNQSDHMSDRSRSPLRGDVTDPSSEAGPGYEPTGQRGRRLRRSGHGAGCKHASNSRIARSRQRGGQGVGRGRQRAVTAADPEIILGDWSETYTSPRRKPFVEPSPGPTHRFRIQSENTAKAYFDLFLWDMIVIETNRYYTQEHAKNPNKHKTEWHDTTKEDVQAFAGVVVLMGIARLPSFEQYWSSNVYTHIGGITSIFSSKRILQIWRYFTLQIMNLC